MPKANPFGALATLPARATRETTPSREENSEQLEHAQSAAMTNTPVPAASAAEPVRTVLNSALAANSAAPPPAAVPRLKRQRQQRTARVAPEIYEAVVPELLKQKRLGQRKSSTFSSLLEELLIKWLNENNITT